MLGAGERVYKGCRKRKSHILDHEIFQVLGMQETQEGQRLLSGSTGDHLQISGGQEVQLVGSPGHEEPR